MSIAPCLTAIGGRWLCQSAGSVFWRDVQMANIKKSDGKR